MQTLKLLIINENESMRRGLVKLFVTRMSFRVVNEIGLADPVEQVHTLQPDVILFWSEDFNEKFMSALRTMKEACPYTLVIVFSDSFERSGVAAAFDAGADCFLKMPILPADLITAVELACRSGLCFFPLAVKEVLLKKKPGDKGNGDGIVTCEDKAGSLIHDEGCVHASLEF